MERGARTAPPTPEAAIELPVTGLTMASLFGQVRVPSRFGT